MDRPLTTALAVVLSPVSSTCSENDDDGVLIDTIGTAARDGHATVPAH